MEISIKWNVCRICLQEEGGAGSQMRRIFKDSKLAKQIFDCAGVQVEPNDSLPDKICKNCLTVLRYAINFRSTCRNSDEYLQKVIQKARSATVLFKMEKLRENSLEEQVDSNDDDDEAPDGNEVVAVELDTPDVDNYEPKRKRTPTEPLSETKKPKVDKDLPDVEQQLLDDKNPDIDKDDDGTADKTEITEQEINIDEDKLHIHSKDILLHELAVEKDDDRVALPTEELLEELQTKTNQCLELDEIKEESSTKSSSECTTFEVEYSEDEDDTEEELTHTSQQEDHQQQQEESLTGSTKDYVETQSPRADNALHIYDDSEECVSPGANDREFFYIMPIDIKNEYPEEDAINDNEHFIALDDQTHLETGANVVEDTIEYLLDSADEQSQTALEDEDAVAGGDKNTAVERADSKDVRLKRKAAGEVRVYVCDICGNHFTNKSLLNFHMKIHRNEKNFECELCFKRFNSACNLSAHMRIHTGEKPYVCQFCDRRFADRSTHIKHERIHTNEKPYGCTICGKSFSLSTSLRAHEKIHTGEKPYRCEPCSKSFKLPHQLKAHLKTHLHKLLSIEK